MSLQWISSQDYDVEIDIIYATPNNFTGKPLYSRPDCWLHPEAAQALKIAIDLARAQNLKLRIYDAFRPQEAQELLWSHTPDPNFLADPAKGSPHSRGVAIDLTLVSASGLILDMGTAFDQFSPLSHHGSTEISSQAQANRYLLLGIMMTAGFDFYRNEWWHYQLFNARERYPLLYDRDLPQPMVQKD
jgi:D-alanyl-D-alanine dipeptidase